MVPLVPAPQAPLEYKRKKDPIPEEEKQSSSLVPEPLS